MGQSEEHPAVLVDQSALASPLIDSPEMQPRECPIPAEEADELRKEKLEAIRQAIAGGAYDSEEILERSLTLMLQKLEESQDSTQP